MGDTDVYEARTWIGETGERHVIISVLSDSDVPDETPYEIVAPVRGLFDIGGNCTLPTKDGYMIVVNSEIRRFATFGEACLGAAQAEEELRAG